MVSNKILLLQILTPDQEASESLSRNKRAAVKDRSRIWPDNTIPYVIDKGFNGRFVTKLCLINRIAINVRFVTKLCLINRQAINGRFVTKLCLIYRQGINGRFVRTLCLI